MSDNQQATLEQKTSDKKVFSDVIIQKIVAVKNSFKTIVLKAADKIDEIEKQKNDMQDNA